MTFANEREVPIATVWYNCDTSIKYIQEHYFHYEVKEAMDEIKTFLKQLTGR